MATTIQIRGREYRVESFERETPRGTEKVYRLHGARGALYQTMRNLPRPEMMFIIGGGRLGISSTVMRGVWLTDKDGQLTVASS